MGAWEDARARLDPLDWVCGAEGGFALDYLCSPPPFATGIWALDSGTGGLPRGEVTVLAGEAGMGKTALACQLAYHAAMRGQRPAYVSLEMSRTKCLMRMVACHAALHPECLPETTEGPNSVRWGSARPNAPMRRLVGQIRACGGSEGQLAALARAYEGGVRSFALGDGAELPPDPVIEAWRDMRESVEGAGGMLVADSISSISEVCELASAVASDGSELLVVDYAQLVRTGDSEEYDRVATTSRELRRVAKEGGAAILVISALRKVNGTERKAGPSLDWLKGNNALAYDAGQVLFMLRPELSEHERGRQGEMDVRDVDVYVAKNRNGQSGQTIPLSLDAPRNVVRSRTLGAGVSDSIGAW